MAGYGNLILKRGTNMPYDYTQDDVANDTGAKVLLKGMPAVQIVGLSQFYRTDANKLGVAQYNYPNRLWCGMDGYGDESASAPLRETDTSFDNLTYSGVYAYTGTPDETVDYTRPLWMGAEIRAYQPLKEDGGANGDYVILKADWNKPSDFVLVTQKAISAMPLRVYERNLDPTNTTPPDGAENNREFMEFGSWSNTTGGTSGDTTSGFNTNFANRVTTSAKYCFPDINNGNDGTGYTPGDSMNGPVYYFLGSRKVYAAGNGEPATVQLGFYSSVVAFNAYLDDVAGAKVALLGSDGAAKGTQSFQSPIGIENYLDLRAYSDGFNPTNPATIK